MSFSTFIAGRVTFQSKRTFSKLIVRIAIVGIMLGLSAMILSLAILKGFKKDIKENVRGFSGDITVISYDLNNSYDNSPMNADAAMEHLVKGMPQFAGIYPFATKPGIIKANQEIEGVVLKGVDKGYNWNYLKANLVSGRVIDYRDTAQSEKEIIISNYTAARLKLKLGDSFLMYFVQEPLRKRKLQIVGIYDAGVEEVNKTFVVGALSLVKKLNGWKPTQIGGYEVRVRNFEQLTSANSALGDIMPEKVHAYTVTENYPVIFEWLKLLDGSTGVLLVLLLAVALINMISALLIMILERTTMIGMLKAMGSSNWRIQQIFLFNAFYLIGLGLLFGNLLGIGLGLFQHQTHFFKLDEASYYMKFVPIQLEVSDIILLNVGTALVTLLVLIIPSTLVSRISPVKAIKFK